MRTKLFCTVGLWLVMLTCACADEISLFGSPSRGMAGAGLALMDNPASQMYINPAAVAYVKGVKLGLNNLNIDTEGATIRQLQDTVTIGQKGVVDLADAARIIRTFGEKEKVQGVLSADIGLVFNGFAITAGAVADIRLYPNAQLQRWARGLSNDLTGAQGDIIGLAVFNLPEVTAGVRLPFGENGEMAVGARVRMLRIFYTHYYADQAALTGGDAGKRADELGTADYLDKRGTGVDAGLVWRPNKELPLTYALVVENLIEPNVSFSVTPPGIAQGVGSPQSILKPLRRSVHMGVAMTGPVGVTYVADWVDVTNNLGKRELRFGAEKRLARGLAIRAGYGSKNGWAIGGEILGINIAVAQKFPFQVARSLKF